MIRSARELAVIARLVHDRVVDGALQRITQPSPARILLHVHRPGTGATHLVFDLVRGAPLFHATERRFANPPEAPAFCLQLRKHLENGRIRSVSTLPDDRVVVLEIDRLVDEHVIRFRLVAELMSQQPCLFVVGPDDRIEASSDAVHTKERTLERGMPYVPPRPPAARREDDEPFADLGDWTEDDLFERLDDVLPDVPGDVDLKAFRSALERDLKRQYKRISNIEEDLRRSSGGDELARQGELLKASLHEVERGMTSVRLRDWLEEGEVFVEVPLDATLTPQENLEAIFQRVKKKQRGIEQIHERLDEAKSKLAEFLAFQTALESGELDPGAVRAEAERLEIKPAETKAPAEKKKAPDPRKPYNVYRSKDGLEIRVGRSSSDNDELTFKHCAGNEWWFHAQDYAGSHVVVKSTEDLPEQTLLDAATLAVEYSKANSGGKQSVSYTRRKFVHKFKGATPGKVMLQSKKTLYLRFEPERLARLEADRKQA